MKTPLTSTKGMTLVEVLVAGVIGIVPAALISVLYIMYNGQLRENNANLALQRDYEIVVQEVASNARLAHKILRTSESWFDSCSTKPTKADSIFFYDAHGTIIAGIGIFKDTLIEYNTTGTSWIKFSTGSTAVQVDPTDSSFILPGCRNSITLKLQLRKVEHNDTFHLEPPQSEFLCRN